MFREKALAGFRASPLVWSNSHLEILVFVEAGKSENWKKTLGEGENQHQTQLTCAIGPQSNPGHIGGKWAFSALCHTPYVRLDVDKRDRNLYGKLVNEQN